MRVDDDDDDDDGLCWSLRLDLMYRFELICGSIYHHIINQSMHFTVSQHNYCIIRSLFDNFNQIKLNDGV